MRGPRKEQTAQTGLEQREKEDSNQGSVWSPREGQNSRHEPLME